MFRIREYPQGGFRAPGSVQSVGVWVDARCQRINTGRTHSTGRGHSSVVGVGQFRDFPPPHQVSGTWDVLWTAPRLLAADDLYVGGRPAFRLSLQMWPELMTTGRLSCDELSRFCAVSCGSRPRRQPSRAARPGGRGCYLDGVPGGTMPSRGDEDTRWLAPSN